MEHTQPLWVFTPSRTPPEDLEFILVQRHALLKDAVERVRESALTKTKHHLLFAGPRGCGKTHLISLIVHRIGKDTEAMQQLRIAWLNEDETSTTLLELLLKIHEALAKRYPTEFTTAALEPVFELKPAAAQAFAAELLLSKLDGRTLMLVVENLDALFLSFGSEGQQQLRALIQEKPSFCIVATAQQIIPDFSDRKKPFHGFFQTEHLRPLNIDEATQLLHNIARWKKMPDLTAYLDSGRGRSRVQALHHLSGGNQRIYIVLSQFITRESLEDLVSPFVKMVDELTPYYQERLRWLPDQQRKIVEYLCRCETTVPVKQIARRLFATPPTISSQLQNLREKGYVVSNQRGREFLYEISEPLMRICVEVKENQTYSPLPLLVNFLRVWYEDRDLRNRLQKEATSRVAVEYLQQAIFKNDREGNLRQKLYLRDLQSTLAVKAMPEEFLGLEENCEGRTEEYVYAVGLLAKRDMQEALTYLKECLALPDQPEESWRLHWLCGMIFVILKDYQEAIHAFTAVIGNQQVPVEEIAMALRKRGVTFGWLGRSEKEIEDYTAVIDLAGAPVEQIAMALFNRGLSFGQQGQSQKAIEDYTAVIGLAGAPVEQITKALINRGVTFGEQKQSEKAIKDFTSVIDLSGAPLEQIANALYNRGFAFGLQGQSEKAIEDHTAVIGLVGAHVEQIAIAHIKRGFTFGQQGQSEKAIEDYTAVIGLAGAPVEQIARALFNRGVTFGWLGQSEKVIEDYTAVIGLAGAPAGLVATAHCYLGECYCSNGDWRRGMAELRAGLELGKTQNPLKFGTPHDLLGIVFEAGFSQASREQQLAEIIAIYSENGGLVELGKGAVEHLGQIHRAGAPFPTSDNLEQWLGAWANAGKGIDELQLPLRLLRVGVAFISSGGDASALLDLTTTERSILQQALGLATQP